MNTILLNLFLFGAVLVLLISVPVAVSASEQPDSLDYEKLDTRLLPWIGSWRLLASGVSSEQNETVQDFLLTISPGGNENAITMKGYRDGKLSAEETIIVDGLRHQITEEKCTGWYQYSWSENGRRLLFNSESNCPGDPPRKMSGMSIFDEKGDWLDIQLLHNEENIVTNTRKYRNVDNDSLIPGANAVNRFNIARINSGKSFSIDEIIELSGKVESEVLEAALLETGKPFPVNSNIIAHLADLKVPPRVIDLMVALSFPDKFNVQGRAISLVREAEIQQQHQYFPVHYHYCSNNYRYFPWHWAPYDCNPYGYSYLGWYTRYGWYYPLWTWPPYYYTGGGGGMADRGRLIRGQGYTRSTSESSSRYAVPRNAPTGQRSQPGAAINSSESPSASSSTKRSSEPEPFSVGPSASPGGYSRGRR